MLYDFVVTVRRCENGRCREEHVAYLFLLAASSFPLLSSLVEWMLLMWAGLKTWGKGALEYCAFGGMREHVEENHLKETMRAWIRAFHGSHGFLFLFQNSTIVLSIPLDLPIFYCTEAMCSMEYNVVHDDDDDDGDSHGMTAAILPEQVITTK